MNSLCRAAAILSLVAFCLPTSAQQTASNVAAVPALVNFTGTLTGPQSQPLAGVVGVTFALYRDQQGGAPLWMETQTVHLDKTGHYTVSLGATTSAGLPASLFTATEARWLGVQAEGQPEQPRIMLLSVPYALKAADAETIGGLPPSAFMLAAPSIASTSPTPAAGTTPTSNVQPPASVTGSGTTNFVPLWTGASTIGNSILFQLGTGATAKLGINTPKPATTLDVQGPGTIRGALNLPAIGIATATKGTNSQPLSLAASSFSSSTSKAVPAFFNWQAEAAGNNTSTPGATLSLLYGTGTFKAAETGLKIASNGQITFAAGQVFPGTGQGTITGVAVGTNMTGGGTSGTVTLDVDATKVPLLAAANTFTGNQTVSGNLSSTGVVSASAYQIGSDLFAFGSKVTENAFFGFAGNPASVGDFNTAIGYLALGQGASGGANTAVGVSALFSDTTGGDNTAVGSQALTANTAGTVNTAVGGGALADNTTGDANTAVGVNALITNTTGTNNTAIGLGALESAATGSSNTVVGYHGLFHQGNGSNVTCLGAFCATGIDNISNATAIGANATVSANNALVLGGTGSNAVSVGIGTPTPFNDYGLTINTTQSNGIIDGGMVVNANGGNLYLGMTNNVHKFRVDTNGIAYADGGFQSSGADFAESLAVRGSRSQYEPGDVLEIDQSANRHLSLSHRAYSTLVVGIFSTKPGLLASPHTIDDTAVKTSEVPLAVVGIVPCKVTTANGPIARGDLLVASSRPGYAMKGTDHRRMLGAVVGKALEPLAKGSGVIEVLVTLQ